MAFKSTRFVGGAGDMSSSGIEGLAMALTVFDKLESKREKVQEVPLETSRFVIYVANSPPYELPVEYVPKYVGLKMEDILKKFVDSKIKMSIICPRKIPVLFRLFQNGGGDINKYKEKNYAHDPKHLVILNGYELQSLPLIQPTTTQNPIAPLKGLPTPNITTTQPNSNSASGMNQSQTTINKTGAIVSQTTTLTQQSNPPGTIVTSINTQPVTGNPSVMAPVQSRPLQPTPNMAAQGAQMPTQNQARMPNISTAPRGARPTQPWPNQANAASPSEILRKQLENQGANKRLPSPGVSNQAAQKQQQVNKNPGGKPQMVNQQNRQGSPQTQLKPGPKPMPGKSLPSPQQGKIEPDSSVGMASNPVASVPMQMGAAGGTNVNPMINNPNQQQPKNSQLVTLLNQGPQMRQAPPNQVVNQPMRQQMPRQMAPNVVNQGMIRPGQGSVSRPPGQIPQNQPGITPSAQGASADSQSGIELGRKIIWTGELQWKENSKLEPNSNKKMEHQVVCSVTSKKDDNGMPEVKPDNWPSKLIMQLIPKTLVQKLGGHFFNHSRSVLFHPQKSESLDILTRVLGTGYAGCVVSQCKIYHCNEYIPYIMVIYVILNRRFLIFANFSTSRAFTRVKSKFLYCSTVL